MTTEIALPDDSGQLDLPDDDHGCFSAVICRRHDGSVGWRANPPEGDGDAWVSVVLEGDTVIAHSWSGWRAQYDLASGLETSRQFTK